MEKKIEIITVSQEERMDDDFKPPTSLFIINAMGEGVYFKTRSRPLAQAEADRIYGADKYTVRLVVKAQTR